MDTDIVIDAVEWRRAAYRMEPTVLRAFIPPSVPGTYVLLHEREPVYVGRSDTCVLHRLCAHEHAREATHVTWEPCRTPERAFRLESALFHALAPPGRLINQLHPAKPAGYDKDCPFCGTGVDRALSFALRQRSAIRAVAVDRSGGCCENL